MNSLETLVANPLVYRLGCGLLHFLWQGLLIAAVLAVALRLLRGRSANVRYLASWTALLTMAVAVPVSAWLTPPLPTTELAIVPQAIVPLPQGNNVAQPPSAVQTATRLPSAPPLEAPSPSTARIPDTAGGGRATIDTAEGGRATYAPPTTSLAVRATQWARPMLPWVVCGWAFGTLALAFWRLAGWATLRRLCRLGTSPASDVPAEMLRRLAARLRIRQTVRLLESTLVEVPAVIGWLRPVILLPASILAELPTEQLELILAHELAHVRRFDFLLNLVQTAVETLLFYHPAVWWVSGRIRAERETCCDEMAVASCGNRLLYARALARLEELRGRPMVVAPPRAAMAADGGSLLARIRRVLGLPGEDHEAPRTWLGGSIAALMLLVALVAYAVTAATPQASQAADPPPAEEPQEGSGAPELWGPAVEGFQVRLDERTPKWVEGTAPRIWAHVRNQGRRTLQTSRWTDRCEIEIDGKGPWGLYSNDSGPVNPLPETLAPGAEQRDIAIDLNDRWAISESGDVIHLELAPGIHTVRVFFSVVPVGGAPGQEIRAVSNPVRIEILAAGGSGLAAQPNPPTAEGWGPAHVLGLQARLDERTPKWTEGMVPRVWADVRNEGSRNLMIDLPPQGCEVEVDGQWYHRQVRRLADPPSGVAFPPGHQRTDVPIDLSDSWVLKTRGSADTVPRPLILIPGVHTVRVAFITKPANPRLSEQFRFVSNPMTVEVVAAEKQREGSGASELWGTAVEGFQVRLDERMPKWDEGTTPRIWAHVRNQGTRNMETYRLTERCKIEVDGLWYWRPDYLGIDTVPPPPEPLPPGAEKRDIAIDLLEGKWVLFSWVHATEDTYRLNLTPGRHTVRVSFVADPTEGALGNPIEAVSNPVTIEIVSAADAPEEGSGAPEARGPVVDGFQARLEARTSRWNEGRTPRLWGHVQNQGTRTLSIDLWQQGCEVEVDGQWYQRPIQRGGTIGPPEPFPPGHEHKDVAIDLGENWELSPRLGTDDPKPSKLVLTPGVHTVRVAFLARTGNAQAQPLRVVSNEVSIEIIPAKEIATRAQRLKSQQHGFELWLTYHGLIENPNPLGAENQLLSLILHTTARDYDSPSNVLPVSLSEEQAARIIDFLQRNGTLSDAMPVDAAHPVPQPECPSYDLTIKGPEGMELHMAIGWGLPVLDFAERLRTVLDGDAETAINRMLAALAPQRERWEAAGTWGQPAEGVQLRLHPEQTRYKSGAQVMFRADVRNLGSLNVLTYLAADFWTSAELQIDGRWYRRALPEHDYRPPLASLLPGRQFDDILVDFRGGWLPADAPEPTDGTEPQADPGDLAPGKHTIRVAVIMPIDGDHPGDTVRVYSNPAVIEIAAAGDGAVGPPNPLVAAAAQPRFAGEARVVDDATGQPVEQIAVQHGVLTAEAEPKIMWITALESERGIDGGKFQVTNGWVAEDGKVRLRIVADGYLPEIAVVDTQGGLLKEPLVFRLKRGHSVRGQVVDHAGKPVAGAQVFLGGSDRFVEIVDGKSERFGGTRETTDADGRFEVQGANTGKTNQLVVQAPELRAWTVAGLEPDKDLTITLPEPATLVLRYDMPGDLPEATFRLELKTWEMPDWNGVVRVEQHPTAKNQGEVVLKNMTPGVYDLFRTKMLRVGDSGTEAFCDRQDVTLEPGKTTTVDFARKNARVIEGSVVGLEGTTAVGAYVFVRSPKATGLPIPEADDWKLPIYDGTTCLTGGKFTTAPVEPGEYLLAAQAYEPEPPGGVWHSGIRLPAYVGTARVTVPEDGPPPPVEIEMKPYTRAASQPAAPPPTTSAAPSGEVTDAAAPATDKYAGWPMNEFTEPPTITCTVLGADGKPLAGVPIRVDFFSDRSVARKAIEVVSDPRGKFTVDFLPAVDVFFRYQKPQDKPIDAAGDAELVVAHVRPKIGQFSTDVTVDLSQAKCVVQGDVVDHDGRGVADATVMAKVVAPDLLVVYDAWTKTDAAGRFQITGLAPGEYRIVASTKDHHGEPGESVTLATDKPTDVRLLNYKPGHAPREEFRPVAKWGQPWAEPLDGVRAGIELRSKVLRRPAYTMGGTVEIQPILCNTSNETVTLVHDFALNTDLHVTDQDGKTQTFTYKNFLGETVNTTYVLEPGQEVDLAGRFVLKLVPTDSTEDLIQTPGEPMAFALKCRLGNRLTLTCDLGDGRQTGLSQITVTNR